MNDEISNLQNKMNFRSRCRAIGSMILFAILILFFLGVITAYARRPELSDFLKFYASSRFLWEGQSIYTPITVETIPTEINIASQLLVSQIHPNLNPPFQSLLISPLGLLSYSTAFWIWSLISLTLGLISIYLIYNAYRKEFRNSHPFELSIIFLLFFPTILNFSSGQISVLLLFFVTIAWISARSGKDRFAGIAIGIALSLKIFFGLFIPVFIILRRWKLLVWSLGTFFVCNIFTLLAVGSEPHIEYMQTISSVTWYSASWNASIMGFFTRIFGGAESVPLINFPGIGLILIVVFSILVVMFLLWIAIFGNDKNKSEFDLIFSTTLVSMLLVSPFGWIYYFVLLIIPLVVTWYSAKKYKDYIMMGLLIVAWILCSIPYTIPNENIKPIDMFTWAGFPFYGLLLFMIISIDLFRDYRNQSKQVISAN